MNDDQLEIQRLQGELVLCREELALLRNSEEQRLSDGYAHYWAEEMLFWRTKYLRDHPEKNTLEYVRTAREKERDLHVLIFLERAQLDDDSS